MKIIRKTDDVYLVEMSRYELSIVFGYDAIWKENDVIVPTKQLAEYHKLRESIEKLVGIMKLEK